MSATEHQIGQFMNTAEKLIAARAVIADPEHWLGGRGPEVFARTNDGSVCGPHHPDAFCFCVVGALRRVMNGWNFEDAQIALTDACDGQRPTYFNDEPGRTHADVLAAFDLAIEIAIEDSEAATS